MCEALPAGWVARRMRQLMGITLVKGNFLGLFSGLIWS